MGKIFNIAGPCNPGKHYMLSAMALGKGALDLGVLFRGGKTVHLFRC